MIVLSSRFTEPTFPQWKQVNQLVRPHMVGMGGYEGMSKESKEKFNFTITREGAFNSVQFIFETEEDYLMFLLRFA
jgi:hypothetical protein